jgi:hypothetical protein
LIGDVTAGTSAPVQFRPDVTALGLPAAAAVTLALAALTITRAPTSGG